ncbi:HNH endonuclease [Bacillus massilinigeriensis]|uniref:HNH endonuclease n=1 Tax=Bacillus massilionigeriensis TaxID=1805475 RepID=UPI00096B1C4E|nr:HNH endonuclease signature motif containing protein [Bacillus massilionigeriensis]
MSKLDQRRINFVKSLSIEVKARVLYEFLKKGTSNRNIERIIDDLKEEDGWQAWCVIHFYGFDRNSKAQYPNLNIKQLKEELQKLNDNEIEEFHLGSQEGANLYKTVVMNKNDGKDVFRTIKTRQGQYKLRNLLLGNYQSKCALCKITHPSLLITSHIKPWSSSSQKERVASKNAILLCEIHDALFENGFISLDDDYNVLFSTNFDFEGQEISKKLVFTRPIKDFPSPLFLKGHREKHGFE